VIGCEVLKKDVKIAAVQMQSYIGENKRNLSNMEKFIKRASSKGVEIICFPELCIHGYTLKKADILKETLTGYSCTRLKELSCEYKIIIIAGLIENLKGKPYITQVIVYPDGELESYRKIHLGDYERKYYYEGNEVNIFSTSKLNFGVQICFDTHFPEMTTIQALNGAEVIFAPHASPLSLKKRKESWTKYLTARAYDNSIYYIACNCLGKNDRGAQFYGGCMAFDPLGNIINETNNSEEDLMIVELKKDLINNIRYNKKDTMMNKFYLNYRRPEIYR
jgi:predicted amidohydrolase